jgi:hypothetical protein
LNSLMTPFPATPDIKQGMIHPHASMKNKSL